ncbi:hypothetical protein JVT61DRAFT_11595 [Boletus reticuloceps]|uniref:PIN domain-containing protein n=1 Tax=Boletus reticuloceps TaxID=495285 RepID=A0A8I2YVY3_9AGAM|nr:hypothetical protein JVT61DRAFT_11595 [Boletus reticuloceps]
MDDRGNELKNETVRRCAGWLEALGDLACYHMAVAAIVTSNQLSGSALTLDAVSQANAALADNVSDAQKSKSQISVRSSSYRPAAHIDNSPTPSVGIVAVRMMQVEREKERWRAAKSKPRKYERSTISVKIMTALHSFTTSRESILPIWSLTAQSQSVSARRNSFRILLHGMLFTNIDLDDFAPTLSRFLERLEIEGAEERQWIMMAVTNDGALLEYGRPGGVLRRAGGTGTRDATSTIPFRVFTKRNVPAQPEEDPEGSGWMWTTTRRNPICNAALVFNAFARAPQPDAQIFAFAKSTLSPYLTVLLTFLTTVSKHAETLTILERFIPWEDLAVFFASTPKNMLASQGLHIPTPTGTERWVFECGYWKSGEDRRVEIEVLDTEEGDQLTDGIIQDEDADERGNELKNDTARRWIRITRTAVNLAGLVDGSRGSKERVSGKWMARWKRKGRRWTDDTMDIDVDDAEADESSEGENGEEDSEEVKALKARRCYLRSLLASAQRLPPSSSVSHSKRHPRRSTAPTLNVVPGYSILVLDTNIILSSLSIVASIIESRWTEVIPVPVIMELDGLCSNTSQLGETAQEVITYITSHIRSHVMSLKVQTVQGYYLATLSVRIEQVRIFDEVSWDQCMDDLILVVLLRTVPAVDKKGQLHF